MTNIGLTNHLYLAQAHLKIVNSKMALQNFLSRLLINTKMFREKNKSMANQNFLDKVRQNIVLISISSQGNPTFACHCVLITGIMNVFFTWL